MSRITNGVVQSHSPDVLADFGDIGGLARPIDPELLEDFGNTDGLGPNCGDWAAAPIAIPGQTNEGTNKSFAGIDASELEQHVHAQPDWLVEGIFSADQPTIFGAASKATKTTQLIDLGVALASGTPWLAHLNVPKRRKTLLITGESNYRACSKRIRRALEARGLSWSDIAGYFRIEATEFPKLASLDHQAAITADVQRFGIEVVIVDPLYRGLDGLDVNRMAEVGSAIVSFMKAVQPASLIISHHVTKSSARDLKGPPSLEDLSGAGLAESCGNWWLLGRNEPYKFDRIHDLVVQFGGRDEQAGLKRIVFDEANWTFEVTGGEEMKEQRQREREEARRQVHDAKRLEARQAVLNCMKEVNVPKPKSWIEDRAGCSQALIRAAIAELLEAGLLTEGSYTDARNIARRGFILPNRTPSSLVSLQSR